MKRKTIAVLFGGDSPEHEVSKLSAANVISALSAQKDRYEVIPVYIDSQGRWLLCTGAEPPADTRVPYDNHTTAILSPDASHKGLILLYPGNGQPDFLPIDAVFPILHGKNGEDGSIQGLCRLAGIPCVGSGVLSSALCLDKDITRRLVQTLNGVAYAPYLALSEPALSDFPDIAAQVRETLGFPVYVKPSGAGSSLGTSRAADDEQLAAAIRAAAVHDRKILVEKAVDGRELEVGILGNREPLVSVVGEIVTQTGFYDYDSKYVNNTSQVIVPTDVPEPISDKLRRMAMDIYRTLECAGMARVDFFLERHTNRLLFNEINTIPGFTAGSMYPKVFQASGVTLVELTSNLIELAIEDTCRKVLY